MKLTLRCPASSTTSAPVCDRLNALIEVSRGPLPYHDVDVAPEFLNAHCSGEYHGTRSARSAKSSENWSDSPALVNAECMEFVVRSSGLRRGRSADS